MLRGGFISDRGSSKMSYEKYIKDMVKDYRKVSVPREELDQDMEDLLKNRGITGDVDEVAEYFNLYYTLDAARYVLEKFKINEDKDKFEEFIALASKYHGSLKFHIDKVKKILGFRFEKNKDEDKIIDLIVNEKDDVYYTYERLCDRDYMNAVYYNVVPKDKQHDVNFIRKLLDRFPTSFAFIYDFIDKKDMHTILNKYYKEVYSSGKNLFNEDELDYLSNKVKIINDRPHFVVIDDSLLEKLRKKYKNKYNEYALKNGLDPEDDVVFMRTMLNSTALRVIYSDGDFNNDDMISVRATINSFEEFGVDCSKYRMLEKKYTKEVANREIGICNYLSSYRDNPERIDELLSELHVDKDNFFNYIKGRKFLDKNLKESALLVLSKHFKTDYISIYDIIDLLQEMSERGLTIDQILEEKNIDKSIFYNIYEKFKIENPELYELMKSYLSKNSMRGFKKLLGLYYSIMNDSITSDAEFVEKYGASPEEKLVLFEKLDLYNKLYEKIGSWHNFTNQQETDEIKRKH